MVQDLAGGHHTIAYLRNLARGNRVRRRTQFETFGDTNTPVLLIHGFLGTRGSMYLLEHRMQTDGVQIFSFNLGTFNYRDIRRSAFLIHRKIESILGQTGVQKIDILGHSMGGLIGLYYVKKLGGHAKVRKLIMMGTPLSGTWAALAGVATMGLFSTSSWQLLPRSDLLQELHQAPTPPDVEYYTIAAARDWVCPPAASYMAEAINITVPLGHASLVVSDLVYREIQWSLTHDPESLDDLEETETRKIVIPIELRRKRSARPPRT